jgi:hypothetical protein
VILAETQRKRRGHNFYPPKAVARKVPALRATEGQDDPMVHLHYFGGSADFFITEFDPETGMAFGLADLFGDGGELGSIYLPELEAVSVRGGLTIIERDCYWDPVPLSMVRVRAGSRF